MKQKLYWLGSLTAFSITLLFILNITATSRTDETKVNMDANEPIKHASSTTLTESSSFVALNGTSAVNLQEAVTDQSPVTDLAITNSGNEQPLTQDEPSASSETETLALLFEQVASDFAAQASFPPFSQPIRSANELNRYLSNTAHYTEIPYDLEDGGEYRARIALNKYRYFTHESLQVEVNMNVVGRAQVSQSVLEIITLDRRVLYSQELKVSQLVKGPVKITVNLKDHWQNDWPNELQWRLRSTVGDQRLSVLAPFQVMQAIATVTGIESAMADGAFFRLPLTIEADLEGYYFVQGIVYHESGLPVLYLATEGPITVNSEPLALQIYGPSLLDAGTIDNLYLANVELSRLADDVTGDLYGQAAQDRFSIPTLDFTELTDELWQDPLFAERLEFLTNLNLN